MNIQLFVCNHALSRMFISVLGEINIIIIIIINADVIWFVLSYKTVIHPTLSRQINP
jgi:hypothetical protein